MKLRGPLDVCAARKEELLQSFLLQPLDQDVPTRTRFEGLFGDQTMRLLSGSCPGTIPEGRTLVEAYRSAILVGHPWAVVLVNYSRSSQWCPQRIDRLRTR